MTTVVNGRPEAEVIVNFADGLAYNKKRLEEAFSSGAFDKAAKKPTKDATPHPAGEIKKGDVDLIMQEFEIPKSQAEKALAQHGGDLQATLKALVAPPPS